MEEASCILIGADECEKEFQRITHFDLHGYGSTIHSLFKKPCSVLKYFHDVDSASTKGYWKIIGSTDYFETKG